MDSSDTDRSDQDLSDQETEPREPIDSGQFDSLSQAFSEQLLACLDESARGRRGLFAEDVNAEAEDGGWPEAAQLRQLAIALQAVFAQQGERNTLCDEFLDLCSIHGEYHPGERRLARTFLERIERGEVGSQGEPGKLERKPW